MLYIFVVSNETTNYGNSMSGQNPRTKKSLLKYEDIPSTFLYLLDQTAIFQVGHEQTDLRLGVRQPRSQLRLCNPPFFHNYVEHFFEVLRKFDDSDWSGRGGFNFFFFLICSLLGHKLFYVANAMWSRLRS